MYLFKQRQSLLKDRRLVFQKGGEEGGLVDDFAEAGRGMGEVHRADASLVDIFGAAGEGIGASYAEIGDGFASLGSLFGRAGADIGKAFKGLDEMGVGTEFESLGRGIGELGVSMGKVFRVAIEVIKKAGLFPQFARRLRLIPRLSGEKQRKAIRGLRQYLAYAVAMYASSYIMRREGVDLLEVLGISEEDLPPEEKADLDGEVHDGLLDDLGEDAE